ncbi:MAG: acyltransferase [Proteobacteria bacterium]|nr:acyltransferase [Pseudomonadota bacterium]
MKLFRNINNYYESHKIQIRGFFELSLLANHFPSLHGLRVIAIVTVVQLHLTLVLRASGLVERKSVLSTRSLNVSFGMDLFFLLSGFLIGMILLHSLEERKGHGILRFYARRSFRIFPAYYVVLTSLAVFLPITASQKSNLAYGYLYLVNYTGTSRHECLMPWSWSLCVEEHFYIVVPILMLGLHLLRSHAARITVLSVLWLSGLGIRLTIFYMRSIPWTAHTLQQELMYASHARIDILVAGILLAYLHRYFRGQIKQFLTHRAGRILFWTIVFVSLYSVTNLGFFSGRMFLFRVFKWGTFTTFMYIPLVLLLIYSDSWLSRFLSRRWFHKIATLGYGIYLVHFPVGVMLVPLGRYAMEIWHIPIGIVWFFLLAIQLVLSVVFAYILHLLVEKPALYLRDRFSP